MLRVIPETQHRDADFSLTPAMVESLWKMEDRHFWHAARNQWILRALSVYGVEPPARVLEVGCGGGAVARALQGAGYQVTGADTAENLARKAHERCPSATFVAGNVERLPEDCRGPYAAIGFFDVFEHLADPGGLLAASLHWAEAGALVVATVPALGSLHSRIDDLSGHKRRYEVGELAALLEGAGLSSVAEHGIFRVSLPLLRWRRSEAAVARRPDIDDTELMIRNLRVPAAPINALMGLLCAGERRFGFRFSRGRTGASLLAVGRYGARRESQRIGSESSP